MLSEKLGKKVSIYIFHVSTLENKNVVNQVVTKTVQMCSISRTRFREIQDCSFLSLSHSDSFIVAGFKHCYTL